MRVRYSLLSDASGSFGGLVASHGRAGQFIRARVRPTNPSSLKQVEVRTIFGNLSTAWAGLTDDRRDAWVTYANNVPVTGVFGDPFNLTGHQAFIRANAARLQAGLTRVDDGPTTFSGVELSPITYVPAAAAGAIFTTINVADPYTSTVGAALLIYVTRQGSGTVRYRRVPYHFTAGPFIAPFPPIPDSFAFGGVGAFDFNGSNSIFIRSLVVMPDGRVSAPQDQGPVLIEEFPP